MACAPTTQWRCLGVRKAGRLLWGAGSLQPAYPMFRLCSAAFCKPTLHKTPKIPTTVCQSMASYYIPGQNAFDFYTRYTLFQHQADVSPTQPQRLFNEDSERADVWNHTPLPLPLLGGTQI